MSNEIFAPISFRADGSVCRRKPSQIRFVAEEVLSLLFIALLFLLMVACAVLAPLGKAKLAQPDARSVGGPESLADSSETFDEADGAVQPQLLLEDQLYYGGMPSGLPVEGELTDDFGSRRNPFNGASSEFHAGQDISAPDGSAGCGFGRRHS